MDIKRGEDGGPIGSRTGAQQSVGTDQDARKAVTTLPGMFVTEGFQ
jgi:hypothetical protein